MIIYIDYHYQTYYLQLSALSLKQKGFQLMIT